MGGVSDPVVNKTLSMYEFGRAAQLPLGDFAGQIAGVVAFLDECVDEHRL